MVVVVNEKSHAMSMMNEQAKEPAAKPAASNEKAVKSQVVVAKPQITGTQHIANTLGLISMLIFILFLVGALSSILGGRCGMKCNDECNI
jgi:hypothetical protein